MDEKACYYYNLIRIDDGLIGITYGVYFKKSI